MPTVEVRYSATAEFQVAEVDMATRFRFEVDADARRPDTELVANGLENTRPSDGSLRVTYGRTVMLLIDPSRATSGVLEIVGVREQSTRSDDSLPPLI